MKDGPIMLSKVTILSASNRMQQEVMAEWPPRVVTGLVALRMVVL